MPKDKNQWKPINVTLEPAAEKAVFSTSNAVIIAGPGAGKTELLAQRASFLLETGACEAPRRILAISFKQDAAKNLQERVVRRCGTELARRFESRTYDSFAKGLIDHFTSGLEEAYRPVSGYDILTSWESLKAIAETNFPKLPKQKKEFWETFMHKRLSLELLPLVPGSDYTSKLVFHIWRVLIHGSSQTKSALTFQMISRLAEYMVRTNPFILQALRTTYSNVFLDEFQDTTTIQYDLLRTAFRGSDAVMTAVGDEKQKIMGWAGALENAFGVFKQDFDASEVRLVMNHRSVAKLVEIQNIIANKLDNKAIPVRNSDDSGRIEGMCEVWEFSHFEKEAEHIARHTQAWLNEEGLRPRDICIVVKQSENIYTKAIINEMTKQGIQVRIEKEYQELLSEEITDVYLAVILIAASHGAAQERQNLFELFLHLQGIDGSELRPERIYLADEQFELFIDSFGNRLAGISNERDFKMLLEEIVPFLGEASFKSKFPRYRGDWLPSITGQIATKLWDSYEKHNVWKEAARDFKGDESIPIMTIHKSKGLEYDSVIFVGMEDKAFWNFLNQREEDKNAFFVAMSRAKRRVIFTFSKFREIKNYGRLEIVQQSSENIGELYDILKEAGVNIVSPESNE